MDISSNVAGRTDMLVRFFATAFTASEGADEGALIGALVRRLLTGTPAADIRVFLAEAQGSTGGREILGCVVFTRLRFEADARTVLLLSPMAVAPTHWGRGIGRALLGQALNDLREEGADIAITYGDPAFYGKVGFRRLSTDFAPPPLPLSQPEGWLGKPLSDAPFAPIAGPSHCADALNDPALW